MDSIIKQLERYLQPSLREFKNPGHWVCSSLVPRTFVLKVPSSRFRFPCMVTSR